MRLTAVYWYTLHLLIQRVGAGEAFILFLPIQALSPEGVAVCTVDLSDLVVVACSVPVKSRDYQEQKDDDDNDGNQGNI